ncbi:DUF421 domain-containing protein [Alloyangia pacifica]|uniref:DUF421 domain-containing protein n=1 Tax=Alloyangia pacifica TaxID=311180 RepID=A0A2U8HHI0_9RHOB|nr:MULTISPECIES: YetF domain-containing protein [Roseobacteraceae]AWI85264.1 DUF421 domain-containing protein [Alloyangia pacifica]NDV49734.1 DUF421 domain-containing protein [Salipiger sp. PrR003]NDW33508.1 DUF421 domain-containing protein [Salipiger sp. PrR007]
MFTDIAALDIVLRGTLLALVGLAWVVICVRVIGLRAFSKMTSFDFVTTIAIGSLLAGCVQATTWSGVAQALIAVSALLGIQYGVSRTRARRDDFEGLIGNTPTLLMRDGEFQEASLLRTRTSRSDVIAKLREANVLDLREVRAVVLESTGDISVLHGESLNDILLEGVRTGR